MWINGRIFYNITYKKKMMVIWSFSYNPGSNPGIQGLTYFRFEISLFVKWKEIRDPTSDKIIWLDIAICSSVC